MSEIGYYRYKVIPAVDSNVNLYINSVLAATKSIKLRDVCGNQVLIKFINKDGQYRFFGFNRFWESVDNPKKIGGANRIISSLLTSQSSERNVGYKNERVISAILDDVTQSELDVLSDLWTSPRVYYYIGDNVTFNDSDWVEVIVKSTNPISKIKKASHVDIGINITLPEWYTIDML